MHSMAQRVRPGTPDLLCHCASDAAEAVWASAGGGAGPETMSPGACARRADLCPRPHQGRQELPGGEPSIAPPFPTVWKAKKATQL